MARVVVHIGRLVVHGAGGFAAEAFGEGLQRELAQRIAAGANAREISSTPQQAPRHGARAAAHAGPEASAAAQVAARLLQTTSAPEGQS